MKFIITYEDIKCCKRIDVFLTQKLQTSKNQVNQAIKNGLVFHNAKICTKNGLMLKDGDEVIFDKSRQKQEAIEFQDFQGEIEVLFEDEDILILNKPPLLVVHNAPSVKEATLVDYLKSKNYTLSNLSGEERYGIIHRLDKPTSGAIAIAKSNFAHTALSNQLKNREMGRYYLAITDFPLKEKTIVEFDIGRNPKNRLKMGRVQNGRHSKTEFYPLLSQKMGLIGAKLYTGRTHQIRSHLESISRHIIGDELYGKKDSYAIRLMLHAYLLYFIHPRTQKKHLVCAPLFKDMLGFLKENFVLEDISEIINEGNLLRCFGDYF